MIQSIFKRFRGMMFGLVLLAATMPFAASAGSAEITLTLKGTFDGRGVFVFEGNTIRYKHETHLEPVNVTVDGTPWDDLKTPFALGFTLGFTTLAFGKASFTYR